MLDSLEALLGKALPDDHARQADMYRVAGDYFRAVGAPTAVLDVGCGNGRAVEFFREVNPDVRYVGIDIPQSPEVEQRTRTDAEFLTYDGVNMGLPDNSFDLIYSNQVLEHVRYPDQLVAEIFRVVEPGGAFLGGVSFLEPYHSLSVFHFSPYGIFTVLSDAGFEVEWMRPGVDGMTLILRTVARRRRFFNRWFHYDSPLNRYIGLRDRKDTPARLNARKLAVAGHILFLARKPRTSGDAGTAKD